MLRIFRIARLSNTTKSLEEQHLIQAWAAIKQARLTLTNNPPPDTFAGRKTQEPFPREEENIEENI